MKKTIDAIENSMEYDEELGYFFLRFGTEDEYELVVEPLLFGNMYIYVTKDNDIVGEKIPVRPVSK